MQKSIQNASKQYAKRGSSMIFDRFVDLQNEVARSNTPFETFLPISHDPIIVPSLKLGEIGDADEGNFQRERVEQILKVKGHILLAFTFILTVTFIMHIT